MELSDNMPRTAIVLAFHMAEQLTQSRQGYISKEDLANRAIHPAGLMGQV